MELQTFPEPQTKTSVKQGRRMWVSALLGCALLMISSTSLLAETYFAIDGSRLTLAGETEDEINAGGLRFRIGTQLNTYVDIETHLGFSFTENRDFEEDDELNAAYISGFLKGYLPIGRRSAIFGIVGLTGASMSDGFGRRNGFAGDFRDDSRDGSFGFSWGFGAETRLSKRIDLTGDFVSYIRNDEQFEEISSFNVGLKLYF